MDNWAFWGGFLAVLLALAAGFFTVRRKLRRFSRNVFGTTDLFGALAQVESEEETRPRSLNGCDSLLLPRILGDFPDFDVELVKTYARQALKEHLANQQEVTIHNVVLAQYHRTALQKTIVLQAAVSFRQDGRIRQTRYNLHYAYLLTGSTATVAANCPNCGGAIAYGQTTCSYCGSRVANVLNAAWKFVEIKED